ncbi:MAG: carboxypeptidase M32, partial [Rhodobacteraceae bacterium]|nr:carboxypeptidase M32 [Paracoccaceae bacterium]
MTAYDKLMSFQRETGALAQVAGRLGWDQEVMMPHGASEQRSEEMAVMESILHARRTDPRVGEWLDAVDDGALDEEGTAHLRHIRRSYERGLRVPAKLATDIARITSRAHRIWAEARADDDFAAFAPVLKEVVRLKREEGAALAAGGDAYDALLDDYEPGATAAQLSGMFGALRPRLVALRQAVLDRPQPASLQGTFDEQAQMMLSQTVARTFGYEMARGRIDKAVH